MAITASKNMSVPGAASATLGIGLGDQLSDQLDTELDARRKMKKMGGDQNQGIYNPMGLGAAAMSLGLSSVAPR